MITLDMIHKDYVKQTGESPDEIALIIMKDGACELRIIDKGHTAHCRFKSEAHLQALTVSEVSKFVIAPMIENLTVEQLKTKGIGLGLKHPVRAPMSDVFSAYKWDHD